MILHESDGEESSHTGTQQSICESPVKDPAFFREAEVQVISPGKLKNYLKEQQAQVLFHIK